MANSNAVERIDALRCSFALPQPLTLGGRKITSREYVVARVTTAAGLEGVAYGYSRGAPIDAVVNQVLRPIVIGMDAHNVADVTERCREEGLVEREGMLQRAISLIDVCLWDIKSKAAGLPLWRLLGGYRTDAPILIVEGYPRQDETDEAFAARLAERVSEGYNAVKIASVGDADAMDRRLQIARAAVGQPVDLIVDVLWAWRDVCEGVRTSRRWARHELAWIEDPFPAHEISAVARLRRAIQTPIGVGDDVANAATFASLIREDAVDVIRLDAMAIGGVSGFHEVLIQAVREGYPVSPHVYPEIHEHCAFAWPGTCYIEMFPAESEFWCTEQFVCTDMFDRVVDGRLQASEHPGLGFEIDWDAVRSHSVGNED